MLLVLFFSRTVFPTCMYKCKNLVHILLTPFSLPKSTLFFTSELTNHSLMMYLIVQYFLQ